MGNVLIAMIRFVLIIVIFQLYGTVSSAAPSCSEVFQDYDLVFQRLAKDPVEASQYMTAYGGPIAEGARIVKLPERIRLPKELNQTIRVPKALADGKKVDFRITDLDKRINPTQNPWEYTYVTRGAWEAYYKRVFRPGKSDAAALAKMAEQARRDKELERSELLADPLGIQKVVAEQVQAGRDEAIALETAMKPYEADSNGGRSSAQSIYDASHMDLVKIPNWYLELMKTADKAMRQVGSVGSNGKKVEQAMLASLYHVALSLVKLKSMLDSSGLRPMEITEANKDLIESFPFSQKVKDHLKDVVDNGVLVRFSQSAHSDFTLKLGAWANGSSVPLGFYAGGGLHAGRPILNVNLLSDNAYSKILAAKDPFGTRGDQPKKSFEEVLKEVIADIETVIVHEGFHSVAVGRHRLEAQLEFVISRYEEVAHRGHFRALKENEFDHIPRQGKIEREVHESVSSILFLMGLRRSFGPLTGESVSYLLSRLYGRELNPRDIEIIEQMIEKLPVLHKAHTLARNYDIYKAEVEAALALIETGMGQKEIDRSRILGFYFRKTMDSFEEILAHKTSNDTVPAREYDFSIPVLKMVEGEMLPRWQDFIDVPDSYISYLND